MKTKLTFVENAAKINDRDRAIKEIKKYLGTPSEEGLFVLAAKKKLGLQLLRSVYNELYNELK